MRADFGRLRGKLQQDRRLRFAGWFLLIVGVVQVSLTILAAVLDHEQSVGAKALNIIIGVWVLRHHARAPRPVRPCGPRGDPTRAA